LSQKQKAAETGAPALQTDRTLLAYRTEDRDSSEGAAFEAAFGPDGQHAAGSFERKLRLWLAGGGSAGGRSLNELPDTRDGRVLFHLRFFTHLIGQQIGKTNLLLCLQTGAVKTHGTCWLVQVMSVRKVGVPFVAHRGGCNEGAAIRATPGDQSFVVVRCVFAHFFRSTLTLG